MANVSIDWHPKQGKRTYVFTRSGHVIELTGRIAMPPDARLVCSEGDAEWHRLPDPPEPLQQEPHRA